MILPEKGQFWQTVTIQVEYYVLIKYSHNKPNSCTGNNDFHTAKLIDIGCFFYITKHVYAE
jgi:hypothetical protein